jgi:hypothetical protein
MTDSQERRLNESEWSGSSVESPGVWDAIVHSRRYSVASMASLNAVNTFLEDSDGTSNPGGLVIPTKALRLLSQTITMAFTGLSLHRHRVALYLVPLRNLFRHGYTQIFRPQERSTHRLSTRGSKLRF